MANKKEKVKKILVDTNFLISILENDSHNAVNLFEKYQNSKYSLYLSSIVHFEYLLNLKDEKTLTSLEENFRELPFTKFDSEKILLFKKNRNYKEMSKGEKIQSKNDDKIICQCISNNIDILVTRDKKLINFIKNIKELKFLKCINFTDKKDGELF